MSSFDPAPAGRREPEYPLRVLFWEATLRCNLFCEFCGSRCGEADTSGELTADEICRVFREVAGAYDASRIMIDVSGGEPLLRRDLFDIMRYAVSLGYRWGIVTNGTLLTDEIAAKLEDCALRTASVSIDGLGPLHDSIRGGKGSFDRVVAAIGRLRRIRTMEHIQVTTVVSSRNHARLPELRAFLRTLPIDSWRVCPVDPIGRARDHREVMPGAEILARTMDFIVESRAMPLPFAVMTSCSHYLGRYELRVRDMPFHCYTGRQLGSVLANGDIFVCANVPRRPELIQGNVRRDSFVEVWENGFRFFRDPESRRTGRCASCAYFARCRGDSMHTWDPDAKEPQFCCLEQGIGPETDAADALETLSPEALIDRCRTNGAPVPALRVAAQSAARDIAVLAPEASRGLFGIFRWGEPAGPSPREQIACLLGRLCRRDIAEEAFIADIREVVELPAADATEDTLFVGEDMFREARRLAAARGLSFLGFVHSHPGPLSVAMSAGDWELQKRMYLSDWTTALNLIVNPQRQRLAAYAGPNADHIELLLLGVRQPNG